MLCIWTGSAYFSCTVELQNVSSPNIKALGTRGVESYSLTDNAPLLGSSIHSCDGYRLPADKDTSFPSGPG